MFERTIGKLAALALLTSSGCALFASANAHHNSRGSACISSPAFGLIDIAVAGISVAAIGASDASAGWYTVPVVFGASGLLGVVGAARCGEVDEAVAQNAPPASNSAPSFGDAPVDPEARDATREEIFGPQAPPEPLLGRNGLPRTLPPSVPVVPVVPVVPPPSAPVLPACTITPRRDCPEGSYCKLVEENRGECIEMD